MRPSEGRGVRQKIGWAIQSLAFSVVDGLAEVFGVPVDDDGGEQIEASLTQHRNRTKLADFCSAPVAGFYAAVDTMSTSVRHFAPICDDECMSMSASLSIENL